MWRVLRGDGHMFVVELARRNPTNGRWCFRGWSRSFTFSAQEAAAGLLQVIKAAGIPTCAEARHCEILLDGENLAPMVIVHARRGT